MKIHAYLENFISKSYEHSKNDGKYQENGHFDV